MQLTTVKIMENKDQKLSPEGPGETCPRSAPWYVDWILEQKEDINGKAGDTQTKCEVS